MFQIFNSRYTLWLVWFRVNNPYSNVLLFIISDRVVERLSQSSLSEVQMHPGKSVSDHAELLTTQSLFRSVTHHTGTHDSPAAWGSQDHLAPHHHQLQDQRQCGSELVGCPGLLAPWSFCVSSSPPGRPSLSRCSPPSGQGSWCTWVAGSWRTNWRWQFHSELWPCGRDLKGEVCFTTVDLLVS